MFDPDAPAEAGRLFGLPFTPDTARVVVQPVPWQATTSYRRGTREGPSQVLEASAQVDLHDLQFGDAWRQGYTLLDEDPDIRAWDLDAEEDALAVIAGCGTTAGLARVNAASERVNQRVYDGAQRTLHAGKIPAVLGGDHSVPFGLIRAVAEAHPGVGILHIDAHADLRDAYEGFTWSHASIFHNVLTRLPGVGRVVQVGLRDVSGAERAFAAAQADRVRWFTDAAIAEERWSDTIVAIVAALPAQVYISFDVDGLDPALCPTTGTPVPGGLSWREATALLASVAANRHIVGFDVNEVGPGEWDGIVGARLLFKLCGAAVTSAPAVSPPPGGSPRSPILPR